MSTDTKASRIDRAVNAAFPGLPDGMTMEEARSRIVAALAAVDWEIREEAAAGLERGARERIRAYGESTGDRQTARTCERAAFGDC
jgi:hypothetical protein